MISKKSLSFWDCKKGCSSCPRDGCCFHLVFALFFLEEKQTSLAKRVQWMSRMQLLKINDFKSSSSSSLFWLSEAFRRMLRFLYSLSRSLFSFHLSSSQMLFFPHDDRHRSHSSWRSFLPWCSLLRHESMTSRLMPLFFSKDSLSTRDRQVTRSDHLRHFEVILSSKTSD